MAEHYKYQRGYGSKGFKTAMPLMKEIIRNPAAKRSAKQLNISKKSRKKALIKRIRQSIKKRDIFTPPKPKKKKKSIKKKNKIKHIYNN